MVKLCSPYYRQCTHTFISNRKCKWAEMVNSSEKSECVFDKFTSRCQLIIVLILPVAVNQFRRTIVLPDMQFDNHILAKVFLKVFSFFLHRLTAPSHFNGLRFVRFYLLSPDLQKKSHERVLCIERPPTSPHCHNPHFLFSRCLLAAWHQQEKRNMKIIKPLIEVRHFKTFEWKVVGGGGSLWLRKRTRARTQNIENKNITGKYLSLLSKRKIKCCTYWQGIQPNLPKKIPGHFFSWHFSSLQVQAEVGVRQNM